MHYISEFSLPFTTVLTTVINNIICNNLKEKKEDNFHSEFPTVYQYVHKSEGIIIDKLNVLQCISIMHFMLHNQINMGYNLKYFIILKDDNSNIKFA